MDIIKIDKVADRMHEFVKVMARPYILVLMGVFTYGSSCTGIPAGLQAVSNIELSRYLGKWHEIARLDHRFERGLEDVTASYTRRADGGIRVLNRGFDVANQKWKEAEGKAYPIEGESEGRLKVSFFGPFYGAYNIVDLDKEGYQYSMVIGPNLSYFWILSRQPKMAPQLLEQLLEKASAYGIDVEKLIYPTATSG